MAKEKRLTLPRFRKIPVGGTETFYYESSEGLAIGQTYAYTLARRCGYKATTETDLDKLTLRVTKTEKTKHRNSHEDD